MELNNLGLPNKAPQSGFINTMLQDIETGLFTVGFLTEATAIVLDTTGKYNFAQQQDAYRFITAFQNRTDFTSSISWGPQYPAGTQVKVSLFSNNLTVQTAGSNIKSNVDTALKQISALMQDPSNSGNPACDQVYDAAGNKATRFELFNNPNQQFYFTFTNSDAGSDIWSNQDSNPSPNWANKVPQNTDDATDGSGDYCPWTNDYTVDTDANNNSIPGGGFNVHDHWNECDDGGTEDFKVTCNNTDGNAGELIGNYSTATVLNQGSLSGASTAIKSALGTL